MKSKCLIVKAKGGMGNRMLCTVTGLLYAKITNREVFVDWRDQAYADAGVNAFPLFFSCPVCQNGNFEENQVEVAPDIWKGCLNKSVSQMIDENDPDKHSSVFIHRKYSIDPAQKDYPEDVLIYWSYIERINRIRKLFPVSLPEYVKKDKRYILRKELTSMLPLQGDIVKVIAKNKVALWGEKVIGVHVRFTDRKVDLKLYDSPIRRMLEKMPEARIFLATDNMDIKNYFEKKYHKVVYTEKWYPEESIALHYNASCPDKIQNGIEALVDMYLLAECDALIYPGHSTFSWISSILSKASPANLIDVTRYNIKIQLKRLIREIFHSLNVP